MLFKIRLKDAKPNETAWGYKIYQSLEEAEKALLEEYTAKGIPAFVVARPDLCTSDTEPEKAVIKTYDLTDDGTGKKYDGGKPMVGTLCRVFPHALLAVGQCIEFGTHKYPKPDNWKLVEEAFTRYQDSMMRHYLKHQAGEVMDSETKLPHLSHMAWNALAILELYLMDNSEVFKQYLK